MRDFPFDSLLTTKKQKSGTSTATANPKMNLYPNLLLLMRYFLHRAVVAGLRLVVHPQPESAIGKERNNKPNKQHQRYQYSSNEAAELIAEVHEYLNDISSLNERKSKEYEVSYSAWHQMAEFHTHYHFNNRDNKQEPEDAPYSLNLGFGFG